jgi:hypothetical protein
LYADFLIKKNERGEWTALNGIHLQGAKIREANDKKIPILGTFVIQTGEEEHLLTYLLQPTEYLFPTLWIFETYNTSRVFFGRDTGWAEALEYQLGAFTHEMAIPRGIDLQSFEDPEYGRCVMWGLVILDYLKKMDLRTAGKEEFAKMYREIDAKNQTKVGFQELQSIVYGASRKTLKRKHRKVKTRRYGSSLRTSRTYKKRSY